MDKRKTLHELVVLGPRTTAGQLLETLEFSAERGTEINNQAVRGIFALVSPRSVEYTEKLLVIARKGARKMYDKYLYAEMQEYDLLTRYLEDQLKVIVSKTADAQQTQVS